MPGGDAAEDAADDDWQSRLVGVWERRFLLPAPAHDAGGWEATDPWAFAEWPDLGATLERLEACAKAGAIGAAFDAIHATEANRRRFWREAEKPFRPAPHALFNIAAELPEAPLWALEFLGGCIAEGRNLKAHRANIVHRLRAWAVAELADVRDAYEEERFGNAESPPLWKQLVAAGIPEAEARKRAVREHRRFTPALLEKRIFDRVREILSDTPLIPIARVKEREGKSVPDGDALRASVRLVRSAFQGGWPHRYYLPSDRTLRSLGMLELAGWPAEIDRRIGRLFNRP